MQASGLTRRRIAHTAHAGREAAARSIKTRATASHLGAPFGPQQLRAAHAAASAASTASYSRATDAFFGDGGDLGPCCCAVGGPDHMHEIKEITHVRPWD